MGTTTHVMLSVDKDDSNGGECINQITAWLEDTAKIESGILAVDPDYIPGNRAFDFALFFGAYKNTADFEWEKLRDLVFSLPWGTPNRVQLFIATENWGQDESTIRWEIKEPK